MSDKILFSRNNLNNNNVLSFSPVSMRIHMNARMLDEISQKTHDDQIIAGLTPRRCSVLQKRSPSARYGQDPKKCLPSAAIRAASQAQSNRNARVDAVQAN
ncbi:hypothetical protein [Thiocystis violascens]|uniref:hypothetical protein n=1 Tax=Thiocystis violascens TaxID=73141 RepID=UPI0012F67A72|nr:hypothetical protein [Thiocystis violascens]